MAAFLRHYLLAVQFFTRLPVTGALAEWVGYSPAMARASTAHLPGVGWLVAAVACAAYAAATLASPASGFTPLLAAVACTIATVLLTGGFHEDGLADVADGLGGGRTKDRALEIMKDSRLGAFGAMALVLALLAKVALLAVLGSQGLPVALAALLVAQVLSRLAPLALVRALPYVGATATSKSQSMAERINLAGLMTGIAWCVPPVLLSALLQPGLWPLAAGLACALATAWMGRLFAHRLGGITGDCLGATQQVAEIACYAGTLVALGAIPH